MHLVDASDDGGWELPVVGEVSRPAGVLGRSDGHVAWVRDGTRARFVDALTTWCGSP